MYLIISVMLILNISKFPFILLCFFFPPLFFPEQYFIFSTLPPPAGKTKLAHTKPVTTEMDWQGKGTSSCLFKMSSQNTW